MRKFRVINKIHQKIKWDLTNGPLSIRKLLARAIMILRIFAGSLQRVRLGRRVLMISGEVSGCLGDSFHFEKAYFQRYFSFSYMFLVYIHIS